MVLGLVCASHGSTNRNGLIVIGVNDKDAGAASERIVTGASSTEGALPSGAASAYHIEARLSQPQRTEHE